MSFKYQKERKKYKEVCRDIASYVDLPEDSLIYDDLKIDRKALLVPKFKLAPKGEGDEQFYERCLSLYPRWREILLSPFHLFSDVLKHESRHAAHHALFHHVYDENPQLAHWWIRKERPLFYEQLLRFTLKKTKKEQIKVARSLLESYRSLTDPLDLTIEKETYHRTVAYGLKESFADNNNRFRNGYLGLASAGVGMLALGTIGMFMYGFPDFEVVAQGKQIAEETLISMKLFNAGMPITLVSTVLFPHAFYTPKSALTTANLDHFTPHERRYLLAFPGEYTSLEKRCEVLKKHGFPL